MRLDTKHSLVLLRHGETEWSRSGQHTGLTDLPLLPEGRAGARRVGAMIKGLHVGRVYCSPLQRARDTAQLAGFDDVEIDDDLVEWDYGGYEGMTTPQIREESGNPRWEIFADGVIPGKTPGETVEDVAARVSHVVAKAVPLLEHHDVALVAHGHTLRILAAVFLREEPRFGARILLDAGAVSLLGFYHGNPCIRVWNRRP